MRPRSSTSSFRHTRPRAPGGRASALRAGVSSASARLLRASVAALSEAAGQSTRSCCRKVGMCGSRTAGTRRTLTLRSEAAASARAPGSAIPHFPPAAALGPPSRAFSFVGPRPSSPVSVQSSRQVVGHEHGTQLAQAEGAGAAAQRRAVQDDARARGGGDGGRGIGGHGAEDALDRKSTRLNSSH